MFPRPKSLLTYFLLALCVLPVNLQAQGFKSTFGSEIKTSLKRKLAAYVNINKKRIRIDAKTQGSVPTEVAEILKTKFTTEIQKDTNFVVDQNSPETVLTFAVNSFYGDFVQGADSDGAGGYVRYTRVSGNVQVSYTATEARTNAPVDSENVEADLRGVFPPPGTSSGKSAGGLMGAILRMPSGGSSRQAGPADLTLNTLMGDAKEPPTHNELIRLLVGEIVKKMAQRAVPVEEQFTVYLPKGKLETISKMALAGDAWGKVLVEAEKMPPFPKPEDESYRAYMIGLAKEALAYAQTSKEETRNYLFDARKYYNEAKTKKPKEEKFLEPYTRVDKALIQYDRIIRQEEQYRAYLEEVKKKNEKIPPSQRMDMAADPCDPMPTVWNNQMIICMFKQGTPAAEIKAFVDSVPSPQFDAASTSGTLQLKGAGLPTDVIVAMMARMGQMRPGATVPPPAPPAQTTQPAPRKRGSRGRP